MKRNLLKIRQLLNAATGLKIQVLDDTRKILKVLLCFDRSCGLGNLFADTLAL